MKIRLLTLLLLPLGPLAALDYEKDIMPIFVEKCSDCHSRASGQSKGGLILDDPKHLLGRLGKNNLVVPGDWDASYLFITLYRPADDEDAMPPKGKGERLTPEEVKLVQQWITEGAPLLGERGERGTMPEEEKPAAMPAGAPANAPRQWTNREGKTITATLVRVEGGTVHLRMTNGSIYPYPVEQLSDESRAALK